MLYSYVSEFNWVDIIVIILLLRMCYVGVRLGLGIEVFKIINVFFCSFIALHFYYACGELLHSLLPPLPVDPAATFSFILLLLIISLMFRVLRDAFFVFFKRGEAGKTSTLFGGMLGLTRGAAISGLFAFTLLISHNHYLELSARTSLLGSQLAKIPIKIYEITFHGVIVKILPDQDFNTKIVDVFKKKENK